MDLSQYKFMYDNGSKVTQWKLEDPSLTLNAHETLTVWVKNAANIEAAIRRQTLMNIMAPSWKKEKILLL